MCLRKTSPQASLIRSPLQTALLVGNGDLIRLACGLVLRRHIENAVRIYVESYLDLRNTSRCRWDAVKVELSKQVVVFGHSTLTLKDLNQNTRLIVRVGCECLTFLCGNGGVALDKFGHHTAGSLQAHRQRSDVQEQKVLHLR